MRSYLFLSLLFAHFIADFVLQTERTCVNKRSLKWGSFHLYLHAFLVFLLSWLVTWELRFWLPALLIGVSHFFIDLWKSYRKENVKWFVIDQLMHIGIIVCVAVLWPMYVPYQPQYISLKKYVALASAVIICWKPANLFIKMMLKQCSVKLPVAKNGGFNAGALIGTIERWLTLVFVCDGRYDAFGFLIAAKSIIRFSEKDTDKTEYVLAGTMLSILIAVVLGILLNNL